MGCVEEDKWMEPLFKGETDNCLTEYRQRPGFLE